MKRPIPIYLALLLAAACSPPPDTTGGNVESASQSPDACQKITQGDGWLGPMSGTNGAYWHLDIPWLTDPDGRLDPYIVGVFASYYPQGPGHPYSPTCYEVHPTYWNMPGGGWHSKNFVNMGNTTAGNYTTLWLKDQDIATGVFECFILFSNTPVSGGAWVQLPCFYSPWG